MSVARTDIRPIKADNRDSQYITFQLSRQYFAIRSDRVRQILPTTDLREPTQPVPYLVGAIPSNGRMIPVVDMRDRLTLNAHPPKNGGSVLVVELDPANQISIVGLLVDKLSEVVVLRPGDIRGSTIHQRVGGRPYGRPKTLVDLDTLLQPAEWERIRTANL